jgi:hypothetical protein
MDLRSDGPPANAIPQRASVMLLLLLLGGIATLAPSVPGFVRKFEQTFAPSEFGAFGSPLGPYVHASAPRADPVSNPGPETAHGTPTETQPDSTPAAEPAARGRWLDGLAPDGRAAAQRDLERHFLQIDAVGLNARAFPGLDLTAGNPVHGIDLTTGPATPFVINPSAAAPASTAPPLAAQKRAAAPNAFDAIRRATAITPSLQSFQYGGAAQSGWAPGPLNSAGVIAEVAYAPFSKPDSPVQFLNLRFAARYVAYTEFNGIARGAGGNNALNLSLWGALRF